jgi:hypothetical protein
MAASMICSIVSTIGSEKGARIGALLSRLPISFFDPVREDFGRDEPHCEHRVAGPIAGSGPCRRSTAPSASLAGRPCRWKGSTIPTAAAPTAAAPTGTAPATAAPNPNRGRPNRPAPPMAGEELAFLTGTKSSV